MSAELTERVIAELVRRRSTVAAVESLTAGAVLAELTGPPGASAAVLGGMVVYATELKHTLAGVDPDLLARSGPVDPEVARQLADGVRRAITVAGRHPDYALATTGVAGPAGQGGRAPGTVFLGVAGPAGTRAVALRLVGDRAQIRAQSVEHAVTELARELGLAV